MGTLLLGMAQLLYGALFWLLLGPLAFIGIWEIYRQKKGLRLLIRWLAWQQVKWPFRILIYVLMLLSASTVCWMMLTHAFMPPHEWDEIAYHLTLPKLYVQAHEIYHVPFIVHSNWPMNSEMLFVVALLLGSDVAPHVIMLGMGLLTACGLLIVAHRHLDDRLGADRPWPDLTVPRSKTFDRQILINRYRSGAVCNRFFDNLQPLVSGTAMALVGPLWGLLWVHGWKQVDGRRFPFIFRDPGSGPGIQAATLAVRPYYQVRVLFGQPGRPVAGPGTAAVCFGPEIQVALCSPDFRRAPLGCAGHEYHLQSLLDIWAVKIPHTPTGLIQSFFFRRLPGRRIWEATWGGRCSPTGGTFLGFFAILAVLPLSCGRACFISGGFYLLWFAMVSHQLRFLLPIVPLLSLGCSFSFCKAYPRRRNHPLFRLALVCGLLLFFLHPGLALGISQRPGVVRCPSALSSGTSKP